jgi:predicted flap endonuclease-1-like 5' DNA nuclease
MASGKRIFGTILFVLALAVTIAFVFLLYAKSVNDKTFQGTAIDRIPDWAIYSTIALGLVIVLLILTLLIRSADERRKRREEAEREAQEAAMREQQAAYESMLSEPDMIGIGPDIEVYSLGGIMPMYRAWEKMNRRTKVVPFYFPRRVDGAVYSNVEVPILADGTKLKLRVLIAGPPGEQKKELDLSHNKPRPIELTDKQLATVSDALRQKYLEAKGLAPPPEAPMAEAQTEAPASMSSSDVAMEIEERLMKSRNGKAPRAYYSYTGDVHDVEDIEGIGRIYGHKLRNAGVYTTERLLYESPERLGTEVGVPRRTVEQWQAMAELVKVKGIGPQYAEALARAGLGGIADLKRLRPATITNQVNAYLDSLEVKIIGSNVTEGKVEAWQKAAHKLRKVRKLPPEK